MNLEISDVILILVSNIVRFYALKRFVDTFFAKEGCSCRHMEILYGIANFWTIIIYYIFRSPAYNIFSNLIAFFVVVLPYQVKLSRKIVFVLLTYAVNILIDIIVVFSLAKYTVGGEVNQVYGCVTSLGMLIVAVILEKTMLVKNESNLPTLYRIALGCVPTVSIFCIHYTVMADISQKMKAVIVSSGILFINLLIFYLYNSLEHFYSARIEKQLFEQMVEVYANQLDLVRESQEQVNALRHDMKHHIIELSALARAEKGNAIIEYLHGMEKFMLNQKEHVSTGNKEIDGVLNYLLQKAYEILEHVDIKITIPDEIYWTNFNVCVILGNLVDNAIREAGKSEEKYLEINIRSKQGILLVFIENSYAGKIMMHGNKIKSSQQNLAIHGIGLENVKKIVQENGGEMNIEYSQERFKVQVLLYLSNIK